MRQSNSSLLHLPPLLPSSTLFSSLSVPRTRVYARMSARVRGAYRVLVAAMLSPATSCGKPRKSEREGDREEGEKDRKKPREEREDRESSSLQRGWRGTLRATV